MAVSNKKKKGFFITFEGGEGVGKSTQIKALTKFLKQNNLPFLQTREPGGTKLGRSIRRLLIDPKTTFLSPRAELLMYEADRAQHVDTVILPALREGKIVISDRFSDSTWVYQGVCRGLGEKTVHALNAFATKGLKPDLVFILNLPEKEARKRMHHRKLDRIELEKASFHQKVHRGFLKLARRSPHRYKVIDASFSVDQVHQSILRKTVARLKRRGLVKEAVKGLKP